MNLYQSKSKVSLENYICNLYSILAFHKIPKINILTKCVIGTLFKENVTYWHDVFFSETFKTEIIIKPFFFSLILLCVISLNWRRCTTRIDKRGILNKTNFLEMVKNVALKIREPNSCTQFVHLNCKSGQLA